MQAIKKMTCVFLFKSYVLFLLKLINAFYAETHLAR